MYVVLIWEDEFTVQSVIGPFATKVAARLWIEETDHYHAVVYGLESVNERNANRGAQGWVVFNRWAQ